MTIVRSTILTLALVLFAAFVPATPAPSQSPLPGRSPSPFGFVDVYLDTDESRLAAWQIDFAAVNDNVRIVGIEGGADAAFAEPPYYDPAAIQGERVIIAALSTLAPDLLPAGRTRVATIHYERLGESDARGPAPRFTATLTAAANAAGAKIRPDLTLEMDPRP